MSDFTDSITVLHVDDDPDFGDVVATFLERENDKFAVRTVTCPVDALSMIDGEPDCIVSDYDMPELTGIEFLERARADRPDLPFILYTGKGSEAVASRAISAGVTDYLQKSQGNQEYEILANRIENAVGQYRAERALERSQDRLRTVIDAIPHPVFVVDRSIEYVISNPKHAAAHDMTVEEVEGRPASEILEAGPYEQFASDVRLVLESGESRFRPRVEMAGPDGETRVYESRLVPIDTVDRDTAVLGIAIDVTDRET